MQATHRAAGNKNFKAIQAKHLAETIEAYLYANEPFVLSQAENFLLEKFVASSHEYLGFMKENGFDIHAGNQTLETC